MKSFIKNNNIKISDGYVYFTDFYTKKEIKKKFNVNINDIRDKLKTVKYMSEYNQCRNVRSDKIENYKMIPFAYVYYYYFVNNFTIPTPKEFVDKYFSLFCVKTKNGKYTFKKEYMLCENEIEFDYIELKARILRSYNTFNREIEFFLNLENRLKDIKVSYDLEKDLFSGMDIVVDNSNIGIAEYVNTKRSKSFKERKNTFRQDYSKKQMIDVVAIFDGKDKNVISYGEVFCYSDEEAIKTIKEIKKLTNKKNLATKSLTRS